MGSGSVQPCARTAQAKCDLRRARCRRCSTLAHACCRRTRMASVLVIVTRWCCLRTASSRSLPRPSETSVGVASMALSSFWIASVDRSRC
eukprot:3244960-Pleurochrysis_carterae.AAC.2